MLQSKELETRTGETPRETIERLNKRLRRAEMLLHVSQHVAGIDTLEGVLAAIVEMTTRETGADRGTLFLNDSETNELYSRIAQGIHSRELRVLNNSGIAGHAYTTGQGEIVHDAYADPRFNRAIDLKTGYVTRNILCAPIKTVNGVTIGVIQMLNKHEGEFTQADLEILEAMCTQAAVALQGRQAIETLQKSREKEKKFIDVVSGVTAEIDLSVLLKKVMSEATRMLNADRSTLFLNNEKTNELWSEVGEGLGKAKIQFPNHVGIAGAVFTSGQSINIPHAYADLRFNPAFDKKTGYFTRSILCVPVINKNGKIIGVTQALNKRGGPFTIEDEARLRAFTAQVSIALENAQLFNDVQNMRNYNESVLQSMSSGVITTNDEGKVVTCNVSGLKMFKVGAEEIIGKTIVDFFTGDNQWVADLVKHVSEKQTADVLMDAELKVSETKVSVNMTVLPLIGLKKEKLGTMLMIDDISSEKRVKATMAKYMDPYLADQLLTSGEVNLGGQSVNATVLFSDIRGFTTLTEELGAQGTVSLLNEYFTLMVDCIQQQGGTLDKFIGDAIMAVFGTPLPLENGEDKAVKAAINMLRELNEYNARRHSDGKKPIDMGIGLNTDSVVSGNIGSPKRMDYTIIGDGVNLASRLESACKQYAARILISDSTYKALKGTYRVRDIDRVVVKGKTEPAGVFEVLDYHTDQSFPNLMDVVNYFNEGIKLYRQQRWDDAVTRFRRALEANPSDRLSSIYIERCGIMKENPPEDGWNGVWVLESK